MGFGVGVEVKEGVGGLRVERGGKYMIKDGDKKWEGVCWG